MRQSTTATKTGGCGVGDLHSARHDPAPSAVTGAIPAPCINRAHDRRPGGPTDSLHPDPWPIFIAISIYYRHFMIYACGMSPGPPKPGNNPRREDFTMATHSTPTSRSGLSPALAADSAGR
jgi:hypothetical protein